jgi:Mg2+/Co2+ transporter CorB
MTQDKPTIGLTVEPSERHQIIADNLIASGFFPERKFLARWLANFEAAAAREKLAAWMIEHSYATGHGDTAEDLLKELVGQVRDAAARDMQERCASVYGVPDVIAAAIRALAPAKEPTKGDR